MQKGKVEIMVNDQGLFQPVPPSLPCHSAAALGAIKKPWPQTDILFPTTGNRITPSYVAFTEEERLVGDAAKNQAAANPYNTIFDIKYVSFGLSCSSYPHHPTVCPCSSLCLALSHDH